MRTVVALGLAALFACAHAGEFEDAKKAITVGYRQMDQAYLKADANLLESLFSPDCRFEMRGEASRLKASTFFAGTRAMLQSRKVLSSTVKMISIKPTSAGYQAIFVWTGLSRDISAPESSKVKVDQAITDTWRKVEGHWKIVNRMVGEGRGG